MSKQKHFIVIGGMNMDILGTSSVSQTERDSLPGQVALVPGGVARNIAQHLAKAGHRVELLCPMGTDALSDILRASCEHLGIGLSYAIQTDCPTSTYMAIHDMDGDMRCAINDMRTMECLTGEVIEQAIQRGIPADVCVLDANIAESALISAANTLTCPLVADPVSSVKSVRLLPILQRLFAIKPNRLEAFAMTGADNVEEAASILLRKGVQQVFISLGKEGVYYADTHESGIIRSDAIHVASLTGAGDAMTAAIAICVGQGLSAKETATRAIMASKIYLLSKQSEHQ